VFIKKNKHKKDDQKNVLNLPEQLKSSFRPSSSSYRYLLHFPLFYAFKQDANLPKELKL